MPIRLRIGCQKSIELLQISLAAPEESTTAAGAQGVTGGGLEADSYLRKGVEADSYLRRGRGVGS